MASINDSVPVMDRDVSLRRLGGNEQLLASLIGFFLEDAPQLMQQLHDAAQEADAKKLAHRAHSLKGLAATFEAIPFQRLAAEIEAMASDGNTQQATQSIAKLEVEYDRLASQLHDLIG